MNSKRFWHCPTWRTIIERHEWWESYNPPNFPDHWTKRKWRSIWHLHRKAIRTLDHDNKIEALWQERKEEEEKIAKEDFKRTQELIAQIDGQEVIVVVKVGEKGQLFESITTQKISEKIKELGFEVKAEQVELKQPIKELGEFPIKVKFEHNLEAEIKVIITTE